MKNTQAQQFESLFPELITSVQFYTEDCENVHFINVPDNIVEYSVTVTASCGCCSDTEFREANLDWFVDYMSAEDFDEFTTEVRSKITAS